MKRLKYKRRVPQYGGGGAMNAVGTASTLLGEGLASNPYNPNGSVNDGRYIAGKTISRTGQLAAAGSMIMPGVGTLVGGAVGLGLGLYEGITGSKKLMKERDEQMAAEEAERQRQAEEQARLAEEERVRKEAEQKAWNENYTSTHPELRGTQGGLYRAKGGYIPKYTKGGLAPLASDVSLAVGPKHEQGGIDLKNQGKVVAEIEGEEVLHDDKVFSDRLTMGNKTYAEHAEKLGKKKGKFEKLAQSGNFRDKNTAERMLANIDNDLDTLFQIQEASKGNNSNSAPKYDIGGILNQNAKTYLQIANQQNQPGQFEPGAEDDPNRFMTRQPLPSTDGQYTGTAGRTSAPGGGAGGGTGDGKPDYWGAANQVLGMAVPFVDNIFNAQMIKKTPEIPKPNMRVFREQKAMPMRTNVDVSAQLADVNDYYRNFTDNIDAHTSNSNVGRANKVVGFAKTLRERNNIFSDKYNKETALINQNSQNIQNVENTNIRGKQDIDNYNMGLTDKYNTDKMIREDNILKAKSQNVSNAVEDGMKLIQDQNNKTLDQQRIMTDALRYNDGAGYARLIGSPAMDDLVKNRNYYNQVEQALEKSGQTDALAQFRKRYGRKK